MIMMMMMMMITASTALFAKSDIYIRVCNDRCEKKKNWDPALKTPWRCTNRTATSAVMLTSTSYSY